MEAGEGVRLWEVAAGEGEGGCKLLLDFCGGARVGAGEVELREGERDSEEEEARVSAGPAEEGLGREEDEERGREEERRADEREEGREEELREVPGREGAGDVEVEGEGVGGTKSEDKRAVVAARVCWYSFSVRTEGVTSTLE